MCAANHFVALIPSLLLARSGLDSWLLFSGVFFVMGVFVGGGGGGGGRSLLTRKRMKLLFFNRAFKVLCCLS